MCLLCAQPTLQEPQEGGPVIILSLETRMGRHTELHPANTLGLAVGSCFSHEENTKEVSMEWCVCAVRWDQRSQAVYSILELFHYSEGPAATPYCSLQASLRP